MPTGTGGGSQIGLLAKSRTASNISYALECVVTTLPNFSATLRWSVDGVNWTTANSTVTFSAANPILLRATLAVANPWQVKFYTRPFAFATYAADLADDTVSASAWVQLGANVNGGVGTSIFRGTSTLDIGRAAGAAGFADLTGSIYGAVIKNGIGGTTVANPDFGNQSAATTAFLDDQGLTYSMNGDAYMIPHTNDGWLLCDGSSVDTTTYADLFAYIRYRHGGSGSSFTLPDFMKANRFPRGGFNVGTSGGSTTTSGPSATVALAGGASNTATQTHTHTVTPPFIDSAIWIKT
jgi:hypothetical protein